MSKDQNAIQIPSVYPIPTGRVKKTLEAHIPEFGPAMDLMDYFAAHAPEVPAWYINHLIPGEEYYDSLDEVDDDEQAQMVYFRWPWDYAAAMCENRHAIHNPGIQPAIEIKK